MVITNGDYSDNKYSNKTRPVVQCHPLLAGLDGMYESGAIGQ